MSPTTLSGPSRTSPGQTEQIIVQSGWAGRPESRALVLVDPGYHECFVRIQCNYNHRTSHPLKTQQARRLTPSPISRTSLILHYFIRSTSFSSSLAWVHLASPLFSCSQNLLLLFLVLLLPLFSYLSFFISHSDTSTPSSKKKKKEVIPRHSIFPAPLFPLA